MNTLIMSPKYKVCKSSGLYYIFVHFRRKRPIPKQDLQRRQDSSIIVGDVVRGASNLESRIDTTLNRVRATIPSAIASVESDIAISNRDKVILALANFLGSKCGQQQL